MNFERLMQIGADCQFQVIDVQRDDLATLVYTSGTTGNPKGVMLTHGNLLSMMLDFSFHSRSATTVPNDPAPGDIMVSILPCWHIFERSAEYIMLSSGCRLFYTNKKHLKDDIAKQKPQFLIAVPRLYNVIYQGVQKKLKAKPPKVQKLLAFLTASCHKYMMAKRLLHNMDLQHSMVHLSAPSLMARVRCLLTMALLWPIVQVADLLMWKTIRQALGGKAKILACGGASLPSHLEDFYEMLGVPITVGYGLTETSPVIAMRLVERNTPGTCGPPVYSCDLKVVDEETGETLPPLQRGLIKVKGAGVTPGYYRNPAATAKLFDEDGYMDTGDVGVMLGTGELVITGRMKELIVLQNGENVAPAPIEDSILTSDLIEQVMVVGQDKKTLGALLVPNLEELHDRKLITEEDFQEITLAHETQDSVGLRKLAERLYADKSVKSLVQQDVMRSVQAKQGYVPSEKVTDFRFVLEPFSVENQQLTQTLKVKRNIVERNHAQEIQEIFTS